MIWSYWRHYFCFLHTKLSYGGQSRDSATGRNSKSSLLTHYFCWFPCQCHWRKKAFILVIVPLKMVGSMMEIEMLGGEASWYRNEELVGGPLPHECITISSNTTWLKQNSFHIQHVVRKVSLELGRVGNKDLCIEVVVAEVKEEDKTWVYENKGDSRMESWRMPISDVRIKNRSYQGKHRRRARIVPFWYGPQGWRVVPRNSN